VLRLRHSVARNRRPLPGAAGISRDRERVAMLATGVPAPLKWRDPCTTVACLHSRSRHTWN